MLQGGFTTVLATKTRDEFLSEIVRFTRGLGFDMVSAMAVVDHGIGQSDFISVNNAPDGYQDAYYDVASMRSDPVMQHCRRQSVPIIWDQDTYTAEGLGDLWEEQASFGFRTGVAMALHMPDGRHFALGVERDQPLPGHRGELTRLVADLQLFAVHAQEAAMRVLTPPLVSVDRPSLTPRELEVLRWTMDGKTAWEIGSILGITERTVVLHLGNASQKLGCTNKHLAVLRALRLGLIR